MRNIFAPLAPLASFFSWLFHLFAEQADRFFSTTNDTHRTERLVIQGIIMFIVLPLISMIIMWMILLSPLMMGGADKDATEHEEAPAYGSYDDVSL